MSDGIEQAAAMWLHGHLKRVKAGLVNIILNYPPGMLAAWGPISPALSFEFGEILQWSTICTHQIVVVIVLELWKYSKYKAISIIL